VRDLRNKHSQKTIKSYLNRTNCRLCKWKCYKQRDWLFLSISPIAQCRTLFWFRVPFWRVRWWKRSNLMADSLVQLHHRSTFRNLIHVFFFFTLLNVVSGRYFSSMMKFKDDLASTLFFFHLQFLLCLTLWRSLVV
jgi:hypothetical protein